MIQFHSFSQYRVSVKFMSALQGFIPEAISGQKCHMNLGQIRSGYRNMGICNVARL